MNGSNGLREPGRRSRRPRPSGSGPRSVAARTGAWTPPVGEAFLLVTARTELREAALTAAAAAGVELTVEPGIDSALGAWDHARAVLVGDDVPGLPARRRGADALLGTGSEDALWNRAAAWGVERVALLPGALGWLAEFFGGMGATLDGGIVLGVWGAVGGAGTTTLAAWLAGHAAEEGLRTLLVSTSHLDAGIRHVLATETLPGLGWEELNGARGTISPERLSEALARVGGFSLLSWDGSGTAPEGRVPDPGVLDVARKAFDLVVLDIASETVEEMAWWCDALTICAPLTLNAALRAARGLERLPVTSVGLVARCPGRHAPEAQDLAERLGIRLSGVLPTLRGTALAADEGRLLSRGRSRAVRRLAGDILSELGAVS